MKLGLVVILGAFCASGCDPVTSKSDIDGGGNGNIDGGADDPDADVTPDAGPGMITVRVFDEQLGPETDARVVFSNPDGSMISSVVTDSSGEATGLVPPGAIVSVGVTYGDANQGESSDHVVFSIFDVQPGDVVEIGPTQPEPTYADLGVTQISFGTAVADAAWYQAGTRCQTGENAPGAAGAVTVSYGFQDDRCAGNDNRYDLLGVAWNDVDKTQALAWALVEDVVANGPTTAAEAWNTSFDQLGLSLLNLPFTGGSEVELSLLRGGIDYGFQDLPEPSITEGGSLSFTPLVPGGFVDRIQVQAQLFADDLSEIMVVVTNLAGTTSSHTVDFDDHPYPTPTNVSLDESTPARPQVSFGWDGSVPSSVEAMVVALRWEDEINSVDWEWRALLPADTASPVQAPALPSNIVTGPTGGGAWPHPPGATTQTVAVGLAEFGHLDGWAEARTGRALSFFGDNGTFLPRDAPNGSTTVVLAGGQLNFD